MTDRPRVLCVDDEPGMLHAVKRVLAGEYDVVACASPAEALSAVEKFTPDLALLDVRMPGMDGFELMRELKQRFQPLSVILMTGSLDEVDAQLTRAVREEAFYYVIKPFDRDVLLALVARAVRFSRLERERRLYMSRVEAELNAARSLQQAMLPANDAVVEGFHVCSEYIPCDELAGDLYDFAPVDEGVVAAVVADVVGHGAPAAMLTALVKSAFRASADDGYAPLSVVRRVYDGMASFEPGLFVTLVAVRISAPDGELRYVGAGHDGGLLRQPGPDAMQSFVATGPIVSAAFPAGAWSEQTLPWTEKSELLLYTDGVTEAECDGEQFGRERVEQVVGDEPLPGPDLLRSLLDRLKDHCPPRAWSDDVTLTHIRRFRR